MSLISSLIFMMFDELPFVIQIQKLFENCKLLQTFPLSDWCAFLLELFGYRFELRSKVKVKLNPQYTDTVVETLSFPIQVMRWQSKLPRSEG